VGSVCLSLDRFFEKYVEAVESDAFRVYERKFADKMISALSEGYRQGQIEPPLVQIIESVINSVHDFAMHDPKIYLELSTS